MDKRGGKSKKKNSGSNTKTCQLNGQVTSTKIKTPAPLKEDAESEIGTNAETNGGILNSTDDCVQVLNASSVTNCGLSQNASPTKSGESAQIESRGSPDGVNAIAGKISRIELSNGVVEHIDSSDQNRTSHNTSVDESDISDKIDDNLEDLNRKEEMKNIRNVEQSKGFRESASLSSNLNTSCETVLTGDHQDLKGSTGHKIVSSDESVVLSDDHTEAITTSISHENEHYQRVSNGLSELNEDSITHSESQTIVAEENDDTIHYISYESELQMSSIMKLIQKDLSEPYSVYTYRYFIHNWPKLCFLAMDGDMMVGVIVCKLDVHKQINKRGYIAMLAVDERYRRRKIGSNLVLKSIRAMVYEDADEIVLETEITNKSALRLYENLGFVRDKRLFRYYLNGVDALRLKLWLK